MEQSSPQDRLGRVEVLIAPAIEAMGYDLVRVRMTGGKNRPTLQIMAERSDTAEMTVDDCAGLSLAISALLDVEDPIPDAYELEVSSPGIDRPLVHLADFDRFAGHVAKVELSRPIDGRKRYRGRLLASAGECVRLAVEDEDESVAELPFADVADAKLVLTDELIRAALKESERR